MPSQASPPSEGSKANKKRRKSSHKKCTKQRRRLNKCKTATKEESKALGSTKKPTSISQAKLRKRQSEQTNLNANKHSAAENAVRKIFSK